MAKKITPICNFGEPAKPFNLIGTDGKYYSLENFEGHRALVVMFICNHCPYVKAILPRLIDDSRHLMQQDIGVVAICSNDAVHYPEDSYENMQTLATHQHFPFPYLWDETQAVAKAYGAVCTPDFFGYNSDLLLQYRGRLDESGIHPASPKANRELVSAMQLISETGIGPVEQMASMGCSIKWHER